MVNRRPQNNTGRRMDFQRNFLGNNFELSGVPLWQGGGPGSGLSNLLPLSGGLSGTTPALASNTIDLMQPRQYPIPSLLDIPIRWDFGGPGMGWYDQGYGPSWMGNQGNFQRTGTYNRYGERVNNNIKQCLKASRSKTEVKKEKGEDVSTKKEAPKTRYDGINPQLLKCHICCKQMNNGRSFENHLSGRVHAIMMSKTAETYAVTADITRQEYKLREMRRIRNAGQQPARYLYCVMCDMYSAYDARHHTSASHRKLKKYLHPPCTSCHKRMPTRIELDNHRLTAAHLRNLQDKQEIITKPKPEVLVISTLDIEQLYLREIRQHPRCTDDKQNEGAKKERHGVAKPEADEKKNSIDQENTILDYKEGDTLQGITQDMFPAYNSERGVGGSFISEFRCVQRCSLCRKLLDCKETAQVHLRTLKHHQLFTRLLAEKSGTQLDEGAKKKRHGVAKPEAKEKKNSIDQENTILDYKEGDNLQGITQDMFPAYNSERGVGGSFISEFRCVQRCSLCHKLLDCKETAQVHLRTLKHHQLFTRLLAEKSATQLGSNSNKRPLNAAYSSDAKRRKTDDGEQQDGQDNDGTKDNNTVSTFNRKRKLKSANFNTKRIKRE